MKYCIPISENAASVALSLASVLFAIFAAELAVRLFAPYYKPSKPLPFVRHLDGFTLLPPDITLRHWDNNNDYDVTVTSNRLGLRDTKDATHRLTSLSDVNKPEPLHGTGIANRILNEGVRICKTNPTRGFCWQ